MKAFLVNTKCECAKHKGEPAFPATVIMMLHPDEATGSSVSEKIREMIAAVKEAGEMSHGFTETTVDSRLAEHFERTIERQFNVLVNPEQMLMTMMKEIFGGDISVLGAVVGEVPEKKEEEKKEEESWPEAIDVEKPIN